jgi:hypothetical protein
MNWQVSGASLFNDTGAAQSNCSSLSARIDAAAAALLVASNASVASFAVASCSFAWSRFMVATTSQVTPVIGWPEASKFARWISIG